MPRSHDKINHVLGQDYFFPTPTSSVEMFSNGNYLDEPQDTHFKGAIINLFKEFKVFFPIKENI